MNELQQGGSISHMMMNFDAYHMMKLCSFAIKKFQR